MLASAYIGRMPLIVNLSALRVTVLVYKQTKMVKFKVLEALYSVNSNYGNRSSCISYRALPNQICLNTRVAALGNK